MLQRRTSVGLATLLMCIAGLAPSHAGDSLYGKVIEVRSADLVVFDYGSGQYELRLVGLEMPEDASITRAATEMVSNMVLNKPVRMRFEGRTKDGEMTCRLFTDDPLTGIQEVAVEVLRAGLARRKTDMDFKYGELAAAERQAKEAKRGLWAPPQLI